MLLVSCFSSSLISVFCASLVSSVFVLLFSNAPTFVAGTSKMCIRDRSSGDYKKLVDRYYIKDDSASNTKLQKAPLSFVISGRYYYSTGSLSDDSSWGIYWSRTATNSTTTYALRFGSVGISPSLFGYRGDGYALRCVAR